MRSLVTILALAVFAGLLTHAIGQEPAKRPHLPTGWSKNLKLTPDQKTQLGKIAEKNATKITALQKQIAELRAAEKSAMVRVLTDDQRKALMKLHGME